jgi:hypothetical protein
VQSGDAKERLAVVNEDRLLIYQYPWKIPVIDLSIATPEDRKYESAVLQDVQFRSPYTVVKFNGSSLDQSKVTEQGISKWKL